MSDWTFSPAPWSCLSSKCTVIIFIGFRVDVEHWPSPPLVYIEERRCLRGDWLGGGRPPSLVQAALIAKTFRFSRPQLWHVIILLWWWGVNVVLWLLDAVCPGYQAFLVTCGVGLYHTRADLSGRSARESWTSLQPTHHQSIVVAGPFLAVFFFSSLFPHRGFDFMPFLQSAFEFD